MKIKAPLFQQLMDHYHKNPVSFHVPGHKMGRGFNPIGSDIYREILKIDMTEISGLDDLHQPEGVILAAQEKAAWLFQSKQTFFLVNGSTSGNLAMILATCEPGDKIIVQRNVHKSVINALMLARAKPIYITPDIISTLQIPGSIHKSNLKEVLINHPDAKAVFITNPNYYGIGIELIEIIQLVHHFNIPLLVDEAHGAHFGFHPDFPKSAIQLGADLVVQSTHKTLTSMTMGSMLHVQGDYVDIDRLKLFLSMVQTSSPSYPIMASLDLARQILEEEGSRLWDEQLNMIKWLHKGSNHFKNILIYSQVDKKYVLDPLKIIIHSKNDHISGFYLQKYFEKKDIFVELSDINNTLLIVTQGTSSKDIEVLYKAMIDLDDDITRLLESKKPEIKDVVPPIDKSYYTFQSKESKVSLEKVLYGKKISTPLHLTIGKIAAEMIIPYPPGIPIIHLGEEITKEAINYLLLLKDKGVRFQGTHDKDLNSIKTLE